MNSRQCTLENGPSILVSWIPEKYAVKGKVLSLKNRETGEWEDGWVVIEVGAIERYDVICDRSQDFKKMKEVTDI